MIGPGRGRSALRVAAGASLLAVAACAVASTRAAYRADTLRPAVDAERREVSRRAGRLGYYVAGEGSPVLLVHSINAAGSAYEVRPIFERLRRTHRTYAVDLPGFGSSDRSDRRYDVALYVDAIRDMADVIAEESGGKPLDALALSLSSEFLARLAAEEPARFRSVAFVTPTGFNRGSDGLREAPGSNREVPGLEGFFRFPLWSQGFFDLLVSRPSIRFFLKKTFGSSDFPEDLLDYDYLTTHQPGAKNAPYAFVSGRLFSKDIRSVYESLRVPVWMTRATRGDFGDFRDSGWAETRPNWRVQTIEGGALPQFERPDEFARAYEDFLAGAGGRG